MESIAPQPEQQHVSLNARVAGAIRGLIPFVDIQSDAWLDRQDGRIYDASYELPDNTVIEVGINDFGNFPNEEQPFYMKVYHPLADDSREVEDYLFGVEVSKRRGMHFQLTSDTYLETVGEDGKTKAVPLLGYSALQRFNAIQVYGDRKKRSNYKERKAIKNAVSLEMDEERAARLLTLIGQCNEGNRVTDDEDN